MMIGDSCGQNVGRLGAVQGAGGLNGACNSIKAGVAQW